MDKHWSSGPMNEVTSLNKAEIPWITLSKMSVTIMWQGFTYTHGILKLISFLCLNSCSSNSNQSFLLVHRKTRVYPRVLPPQHYIIQTHVGKKKEINKACRSWHVFHQSHKSNLTTAWQEIRGVTRWPQQNRTWLANLFIDLLSLNYWLLIHSLIHLCIQLIIRK